MNKSKLTAFLSLVLVFGSGVVLGAVGYRLYSVPAAQTNGGTPPGGPPQGRPSPAEIRKHYTEDLTKAAKLDSEQVKKLSEILDETGQEFTKLRERSRPEWEPLAQKKEALDKEREVYDKKWRPEREAIQNHQVEQINAILRDDQKKLFADFRVERDRQRKLRDQQHKKQ